MILHPTDLVQVNVASASLSLAMVSVSRHAGRWIVGDFRMEQANFRS